MFTGIIKEQGIIKAIKSSGNIIEFNISCQEIFKSLNLGDSVSVNGCCLTVTSLNKLTSSFVVQVTEETINRTNFYGLKEGMFVNLEPALNFDGKIDGHIVAGHIDCTGRVLAVNSDDDNIIVKILFPEEYKYFIAPKGSISVNGVSLTVIDSDINSFSFTLIPFTRDNTNLGLLKTADLVNLEVDLISRYIVNCLKHSDTLKFSEARGNK